MNLLLALFVVVAFAATIDVLGLPQRAWTVVKQSRASLKVLRNPSLGDRAKEKALQRHARRLFGLLGILLGGSALSLGWPLLGVWGLEKLGVASLQEVLFVLQRADFLAGTAAAGLLGYLLIRYLRPP